MSDARIVERFEDMSPTGRLQLVMQPDGDVIVHAIPDLDAMRHFGSSVEFCSPGGGGGRSPHTIRALRELAKAIELDNAETPIVRRPYEPNKPSDEAKTIAIDYTNWKGERSIRRIIPDRIWFGSSPYHPEPQWLLDATDVEKGAARTFALRDVHEFGVRGPTVQLGHVEAPRKPARPATSQDEAERQGRRVPKLSAILPALDDMTADPGPIGTAAYLVATWIKANPNLSALHPPRVHHFAARGAANVLPTEISMVILDLVERGLLVEWRGVISPEGRFVPGYWRKGQRIPKRLYDLSDRRIRRDDGEIATVYRAAEPPEAEPTD